MGFLGPKELAQFCRWKGAGNLPMEGTESGACHRCQIHLFPAPFCPLHELGCLTDKNNLSGKGAESENHFLYREEPVWFDG